MVNTRSKMQRTNQKARAWLTSNGYNNLYFFPHMRHMKDWHLTNNNITADFDGIATHNNKITFFQCKTNKKATKKTLREYAVLEKHFNIELLWINYINRKGLQINNNNV